MTVILVDKDGKRLEGVHELDPVFAVRIGWVLSALARAPGFEPVLPVRLEHPGLAHITVHIDGFAEVTVAVTVDGPDPRVQLEPVQIVGGSKIF